MSVLTPVERMILINQLTILERVDPHEAEYYGNSRKAIENGFELEIEGYVRPSDTGCRPRTVTKASETPSKPSP
jgi:uncharacterized protein YfbU (UPF0304 family)